MSTNMRYVPPIFCSSFHLSSFLKLQILPMLKLRLLLNSSYTTQIQFIQSNWINISYYFKLEIQVFVKYGRYQVLSICSQYHFKMLR